MLARFIPVLLVEDGRLVKGVRFAKHRYLGDPMNAIRIFNAYKADELALIDIGATRRGSTLDHAFVRKVSTECLMPVMVGGGVRSVEAARALLSAGAEKVLVGTEAAIRPQIVGEMAKAFGSQSVVVSVDVRARGDGYAVYSENGRRAVGEEAVSYAKRMVELGAGEILVNDIDRDGTRFGYDIRLLRRIAAAVEVPIIALGGAGRLDHLVEALSEGHASAAAAGSLFVFHGRRQAVLITYPTRQEIDLALGQAG